MIYVSIYDKPVHKLSLEELSKFFIERVFFDFMDSGRTGIQKAVKDLFDNVVLHYATNHKKDRTKLDPITYERAVQELLRWTVNGFITDGTRGLNPMVVNAFTIAERVFKESEL